MLNDENILATDDEAMLQALRNLWPILSAAGRRQAIDEAERIKGA